MASFEVMDLVAACQSFPLVPQAEVKRDNLIETLETMLEGDCKVVFIEGREGIGKTALASQFSRQHNHRSFSLFVNGASRWTRDCGVLLYDLCNQLRWAVDNSELAQPSEASEALLRECYMELRRRAVRQGEVYYFVVDGLDEVPDDEETKCGVFEMLPWGMEGFRFIITGDYDTLRALVPRGFAAKSFHVPTFTLDETTRYLEGLNLDRNNVQELHNVCRGIPGHLTSARRILLQKGMTVQQLVDQAPQQLPSLFEIEWRDVDLSSTNQVMILAILAHDKNSHYVADLGAVMGLSCDEITSLVCHLGFITISTREGEVSYVSEAFRRFAAAQLEHLRTAVYDAMISNLVASPESDRALLMLPEYLRRSSRLDQLIEYLTDDHFAKMLTLSQSLAQVQHATRLGVDSALDLQRDDDLMRFGIDGSLLHELGDSDVWRSEVEARMSLRDYGSALALAQSCISTEDRLHLLAVIARAGRELGGTPEPGLMEQIHHLYGQIDPGLLGSKAVDIAVDLAYSDLETAIELVERAARTERGIDENALDWAFARLSIQALRASDKPVPSHGFAENLGDRIRDPKLRQFTRTAALLIGEWSVGELLAQCEKFSNAGERIFLLRQWAVCHPRQEGAHRAVEAGLRLMMQTGEYTPTARDLREICSPLPFVAVGDRPRIIRTVDSQKAAAERLGPSEDFVRLQLTLAKAEMGCSSRTTSDRLVETYYYIDGIGDLLTRTACLASLASSVRDIDPMQELPDYRALVEACDRDLRKNLHLLLEGTADHFRAVQPVLTAISASMPHLAHELIKSLNTAQRRDEARFEVVRSCTLERDRRCDREMIQQLAGEIEDPDVKDDALMLIIERLCAENGDENDLPAAVCAVINCIPEIHDPIMRCRAYTLGCRWLGKNAGYEAVLGELQNKLEESWRAIDSTWHRIDAGYRIARELGTIDPEVGRAYLARTDECREGSVLGTQDAADTYVACLRLTIRAYAGLLCSGLDAEEEGQYLEHLIDIVPSSGVKAELWACVALAHHLAHQDRECQRIVSRYVRPLTQGLMPESSSYWRVAARVAPALYAGHRATAVEIVEKLPQPYCDVALSRICYYLLRKTLPLDPYERVPNHVFALEFESVVDLVGLMARIDSDTLLYELVEMIADSVTDKKKNNITQQQLTDIADRLEALIEDKLPNPRHIQHAGYKIIGQAQIARMRRAGRQEWDRLIAEAQAIPNIADKALVLTTIAGLLGGKTSKLRTEVLIEVQSIIDTIPTSLDRIERLESLADVAVAHEPGIARECLRSAMECSTRSDDPEVYAVQRRLVDQAFRVDEQLAVTLASTLDDDPARDRMRENVRRRLRIHELKRQMMGDVTGGGTPKSQWDRTCYPEAAWKLLGALNAGRSTPVPPSVARNALKAAADLPLSEAYPIYAWAIQNSVVRFAKTPQASRFLRPLMEAGIQAARLTIGVANRSAKMELRDRLHQPRGDSDGSLVISPGERDNALAFIREWLQQAQEYLKICDPYLTPDDLDLLLPIRSEKPDCYVQILTSVEKNASIAQPWNETYRRHWRTKISGQEPPETDIVIAGTETKGKLPIHDRWWLTKGGGLRLGTSWNSMGVDSSTELSVLSPEQADQIEHEVDLYLTRTKREVNGNRIQYYLFTL